MELKDLIKNKTFEVKKSKITNQRQELIKMFLEKLNSERGKYKPLTPGFVASKMFMLSTKDLYEFYGTCNESKCFSKYWWWSIKTNK